MPDGLWVVEKSNWTGVGLVIPRSIYTRVRSRRDELLRAGAYVLLGPSETNPDRERIYIGEAEVLRSRIDSHFANKDFWTRIVAFTTKDGSLNKAHVKYLEARLVRLAHDADRVEVENGNAPQPPALSEPEVADTDAFLRNMLLIYPVLGLQAFERPSVTTSAAPLLYLHGPDAAATGKESADGFVVLAGAAVRPTTSSSMHKFMADVRQSLIEEGVIHTTSDGLQFARDYVFKSPSTAAAVVLGRNANGRIEWKDAHGKTLKEIQTEAVAKSDALVIGSRAGSAMTRATVTRRARQQFASSAPTRITSPWRSTSTRCSRRRRSNGRCRGERTLPPITAFTTLPRPRPPASMHHRL